MTGAAVRASGRIRVRGAHRFTDARLAEVAATHGREEAWKQGFASLGPDVVNVVAGDFSVVIEDDRRAFAAVDRFGTHPMCYRFEDGRLVADERANEVAAAQATVDPQALFDYLYFHVIPAPRTIFRGVSRLPAAHYALAENGRLQIRRWWNPAFIEDASTEFPALRDEFRRILRESVAGYLDGPAVGCFLSGGTDSSTVAGLVTELAGHPAKTFSIGFDAAGYDEMSYARIAARHFKTEHHEYYVSPDDIADAVSSIAASFDQPFGNSSVLPAYYCARLAREHGVERMLAGDGGDELFGGNSRYAKQRVFDAYLKLPSGMRSHVIEPLVLGKPALRRVPAVRKLVSYIEQAKTPLPERLEMYNLLVRLGVAEILAPEFLAVVDPALPSLHIRETFDASAAHSAINRMLQYDWKLTLADNDLPKVRGATTLAGVDVGFPFLDERIVDFSLRLPPELKLKRLQLRWFFKRALRGFLPDEIIAKRKHGFGLPFGVWLTKHARLRELAFDSLRSLAGRHIVRRDFLSQLTDELVPQHPGYYGELVWILMTLELWMAANRKAAGAAGGI